MLTVCLIKPTKTEGRKYTTVELYAILLGSFHHSVRYKINYGLIKVLETGDNETGAQSNLAKIHAPFPQELEIWAFI